MEAMIFLLFFVVIASVMAHTENLAELNDAIYGLKQYVSNNRTEKLNERLNAYAALRADGKTKKEAAAEIGISYRTASRYEKSISIVDLD